MNEIQVLFILLSVISLLSTLICGIWIRYGPQEEIDDGSIKFHMGIAILSIVITFIMMILFLL